MIFQESAHFATSIVTQIAIFLCASVSQSAMNLFWYLQTLMQHCSRISKLYKNGMGLFNEYSNFVCPALFSCIVLQPSITQP